MCLGFESRAAGWKAQTNPLNTICDFCVCSFFSLNFSKLSSNFVLSLSLCWEKDKINKKIAEFAPWKNFLDIWSNWFIKSFEKLIFCHFQTSLPSSKNVPRPVSFFSAKNQAESFRFESRVQKTRSEPKLNTT